MSLGKKQVKGYYYFLGLHFVLCHGPIDWISEILFDKKIAQKWNDGWTGGQKIFFALDLFGGAEKEGGVAGPFDLDMGHPTQTPNPYLVSKLVGQLVPAFRGLCSVIGRQIYVGTTTYLKNPGFRAKRIHVRQSGGIAQWYDVKSEITAVPGTGELITSVGIGSSGGYAFRSSDGVNFANQLSGIAVSAHVFQAGNRYIAYAGGGYASQWTLDGINWSAPHLIHGGSSGSGVAGRMSWFKGEYLVMGDGTFPNHAQYSSDYGLSWNPIDGAPALSTIICSDDRMVGFGHYTSDLMHCDDPLIGGWTTGGAYTGFMSTSRGFCGDWDGTNFLIGGSSTGGTNPVIIRTVDANVIFADTLPAGMTGAVYCHDLKSIPGISIALCVGTAPGQMYLIWKLSSQTTWTLSNYATAGSNNTAYPLSYANGRWYVASSTETKWSTDLINWNTLTGTAGPLQVTSIASGITFDSRTISRGDMNPAHIVRECLTDPDWGMGYQDADIDDPSFMTAADTLYAEGMGISILWNKQVTIEDFIKDIIKHIDGSLFLDRATGKFKLKLVRDDYIVSNLIVLDPSNIDKIENFTRPSVGELTNAVTVKYWDGNTNTDASVTVQDIALVTLQQATINVTIEYPGFTKADLATRVAQRDLRTLSTPIISCTLYCNKDAAPLTIGDAFKLTWPDYNLDELIMRVTGAAYGDGKSNRVRLSATQDVYSMPMQAILVPPAPVWVDPSQPPVPVTIRMPYEVPYLEAVQQFSETSVNNKIASTPDVGYVGMAAVRPSEASINAHMLTNSGAGYLDVDTLDFSPSATLVAALDKMTTAFDIADATDLGSVPAGSWLQCGQEIMGYVSYVAPTLTVKRGLLDTVPASHSASDRLLFWDAYSANDPTEYVADEAIGIKLLTTTPQGTLIEGDAPSDSLTLDSRMVRPYPPGQFKINGSYYPAGPVNSLTVSWVHRDRLQQTSDTYLGFLDGGIGPEAGTTYNVSAYNNATNALLAQALGVTGTTVDLGIVAGTFDVRVELESKRDGYISWQGHSHVVAWSKTALGRVLEDSSPRYLEDGTTQRMLE